MNVELTYHQLVFLVSGCASLAKVVELAVLICQMDASLQFVATQQKRQSDKVSKKNYIGGHLG